MNLFSHSSIKKQSSSNIAIVLYPFNFDWCNIETYVDVKLIDALELFFSVLCNTGIFFEIIV